MTPAQIIEQATADGLTLTVSDDGKLNVDGDQRIVDDWLPLIRGHKAGITELLRTDLDRCVMTMLARNPEKRYAVVVNDASADPVLVRVGIRGLAIFNLEIPHAHYDGIALLEVIEQHSSDTALNLGSTYPLPEVKQCSLGPPDERRNVA